MKELKVLVADDDPNVCEIIRLYFEEHHIQVVEANDGEEAVRLTAEEQPDVIILDVMMPGMDGYDVTRQLRTKTDVPIIMLTAKDSEIDRVLGLELGADDYVTKPFSPRELVARIKAILRRMSREREEERKDNGQGAKEAVQVEAGPLFIDAERREVSVHGQAISLRPKEFDLLLYLARHPGVVLGREQLLEQVWGYDFYGDMRTVDAHIKKLRKKLNEYDLECIHTVWGVGYRFELPADKQGRDGA
ncbi:two-component system response regulator ResD [Caldalkalibacillus uzonensis]|uniref:Two-component system response regulator ResD n=1 Tax=Caldalkalibacillus uzonensis TaxID=353224 RepID=A0ABU0CU48_9BACI|nr:response regulator transcription factor [Caldalkalibacillus uzonensis]MDQ0339409.1 two-component system response regulator ResD [Caldalkalibacillus uzonensis]